jgi:hypothetical protein
MYSLYKSVLRTPPWRTPCETANGSIAVPFHLTDVSAPWLRSYVRSHNFPLTNKESIQKPDTIVHLGITHHRNYRKTTSTQIQENMEKSRCTLYSLLGAGLHGKNGLNPTACLHLLQVYVIPILTYGLEILLPSRTELQTLEMFYRKIVVLHILAYMPRASLCIRLSIGIAPARM